jgi:hypothetical protein
MDLIFKPNRFFGTLSKRKEEDENITILNFGDVNDGDILMSVKAEEEVVNKNDRSDVQKAIDKTSIRGDQNIKKHIQHQQEKTKNAPVPVRENIKMIDENVDYKDILLNNIRDRYNKFNGDRTIINAVKKKANEEFMEWNKNVNTGALANVDDLKAGTELIQNDKKLPTVNPLFELPEDEEEVDLNKPNLIPTQLKEIKKKIKNQVLQETQEASRAKSTLNIPANLDTTDYDNLAGSTNNNMGVYNRQAMKMYDIGGF